MSMTADRPQVKTCRKPASPKTRDRDIRLLTVHATAAGVAGILEIREKEIRDRYFFSQLDCDYATGFEVEKWQDATDSEPAGIVQSYHVCLNGKHSTCECKGFLRWGHCRHVEGLTALRDAGKLVRPCDHEAVFRSDDDEIVCHDCGRTL